MGANKEKAIAKREGPKEGGSGVQWDKIPHSVAGVGVDWNSADPALLASVVHLGTRAGMAVSFSATANGQAVSITLLDGGHRPKWYANNQEELDRLLPWLIDILPDPNK